MRNLSGTIKDTSMIIVKTNLEAPLEEVWNYWSEPEHIVQWNHASADWHTTKAEIDLRPGGTFSYRMEARDGSEGFDFGGTYDRVREFEYIEYTLEDCRKVKIEFSETDDGTTIREAFEPEGTNTPEKQAEGWQAILDQFKRYVESR